MRSPLEACSQSSELGRELISWMTEMGEYGTAAIGRAALLIRHENAEFSCLCGQVHIEIPGDRISLTSATALSAASLRSLGLFPSLGSRHRGTTRDIVEDKGRPAAEIHFCAIVVQRRILL